MGGGRGDLRAPALLARRDTSATEENAWRAAARNGLLLITVWCLGSMLMRITDLAVAVSLNYPFSRYDSMVLAAFDLATAVLAIWLRINLGNDTVSARLISSLCGLVATLSISRVVVGVALAPRFEESPNAPAPNPVYGNNLAQQITSTFDVALCALALCILAAAIVTGHLGGRRLRRQKRRAAHKRAAGPRPAGPGGDDAHPPATPPRRRPRRRRASRPAAPAWTPPPGRCRSWPVRRESSGRKTRLRHAADPHPEAQDFPAPARFEVARVNAKARTRIRASPRADRRPPGNPAPRRPGRDRRRCGARRRCGTAR